MKIDAIGKVIHGATLSRIEAKADEEFNTYTVLTLQDLSRETGQYSIKEEMQKANICKNKFDSNYISKVNTVVIGLTSYKAIVISETHKNKLITSNSAIIDFDEEKIDPFYFTWYFNEHSEIKKQLTVAMQGSIVRALSVQMLRELEVPIPPLDVQRKIGKIYKLRKTKGKLLFERNILENELYNQLMINKLKEEIKCQ